MIHSTTHISKNAEGQEEVHIDRDMTLWEVIKEAWRLKSIRFKKEVTKEYICIGQRYGVYADKCDVWVNKETSNEVSDEEYLCILKVKIDVALNTLRERNRQ